MAHYPSSPGAGEDNDSVPSITPTHPPFLHRARSSTWSAVDTPSHHNQGTSYFTQRPSSPTPQFHPSPILKHTSTHPHPRREVRSRSGSTNRGYLEENVLSEEDEDNDEEDGPEERVHHVRRRGKAPAVSDDDDDSGEGDGSDGDEDPIRTLKDRQSLINVQHPFGLPIWKPALYKKTRSVTRHADEALHSIPSAQAERHLLPGNLFWAIAFGWWLGAVCIVLSILLRLVPQGGENYSNLIYGLGWYLFWPFGKYVEGPEDDKMNSKDDDEGPHPRRWSDNTVRGVPPLINVDDNGHIIQQPPFSETSTITPGAISTQGLIGETTPLLGHVPSPIPIPVKSYGTAMLSTSSFSIDGFEPDPRKGRWIGKACFWLALITIIAPLLLFVCMICWALVVTIPMAKLNWVLLENLFGRPTQIRFCAVPLVVVPAPVISDGDAIPEESAGTDGLAHPTSYSVKHARLSAGQAAPSGSHVLLCTYRAVGLKYYKYTVGGVNIMFINLLPVVFFVIFDGFVLLPLVEQMKRHKQLIPAFLAFLTSRSLIFFLSLLSVIPLSYFIGMAVASISAQSSIGMGAVINATFGSIIEIILYAIALTQSKGHLVEGSIVGSLLAGVLLMPGMSMCSGALRRKEQTFNAKSASVTSMMLIMAIIGALAPTLFYQTYGNVRFVQNKHSLFHFADPIAS